MNSHVLLELAKEMTWFSESTRTYSGVVMREISEKYKGFSTYLRGKKKAKSLKPKAKC